MESCFAKATLITETFSLWLLYGKKHKSPIKDIKLSLRCHKEHKNSLFMQCWLGIKARIPVELLCFISYMDTVKNNCLISLTHFPSPRPCNPLLPPFLLFLSLPTPPKLQVDFKDS